MKYIFTLSVFIFLSGCDCSSFIDGNLFGDILFNSDKCEYNLDVIELESRGGYVEPAIKISNQIKLNDTNTTVRQYCNSACVMLAVSGNHRKMCARGVLGFHQGSNKATTRKVLEFYKDEPRVDYEAVKDLILSRPFDEMTYIGAFEAKSLGLIDEIILCIF